MRDEEVQLRKWERVDKRVKWEEKERQQDEDKEENRAKSKDKQRDNALLLDTANHMDQHQCFVISQQEVKK